jgi:hypothetical protein
MMILTKGPAPLQVKCDWCDSEYNIYGTDDLGRKGTHPNVVWWTCPVCGNECSIPDTHPMTRGLT